MTHTDCVALDAITRAAKLRRTADLERARAIAAARSAGLSLRAIAEAAGVSISRAQQIATAPSAQKEEPAA